MIQEHLTLANSPARVVPLEPTLKTRRYVLFFGIAIGAAYIVTLLFFRSVNKVIFYADPFFAFLWLYSFYPIIYVVEGKTWRALEKKRQEAARYNLALGLSAQSAFRRDLSDVPARFAIRLRRRWLATYVLGIAGGLLLVMMAFLLYFCWADTVSMVIHQQESIVLALLQTALNITVLLVSIVSLVLDLYFGPRQQLTATQDGLFCRQRYHFRYIPWEQVRLFAVIGEGETKKRRDVYFYEVSSEATVIRWSSLPMSGRTRETPGATIGVTGWLAQADCSERAYQQQIQTLIAIVASRTGLPLYDLR